ncbi:MAG: ribonuclease III [candidate division KSB1 bacterium]|nr:ribonuclease III [candidate division KSB1 bacterium]
MDYKFENKKLLYQALKHRSYLAYSGECRTASNERLELLGDSVLGLVVTEFLFDKFPKETEGILTNYKSLLVSGRLLAEIAKDFDLGGFLLLNDSEERTGGRKRRSLLADAVEAIIGAIYLDGGLPPAKEFIHHNITWRLDSLLKNGQLRNNKSLLQEHCQSLGLCGPFYKIEHEEGPDHKKHFTVSVTVDKKKLGYGEGTSKKRAEQKAASEALQRLDLI